MIDITYGLRAVDKQGVKPEKAQRIKAQGLRQSHKRGLFRQSNAQGNGFDTEIPVKRQQPVIIGKIDPKLVDCKPQIRVFQMLQRGQGNPAYLSEKRKL